MSKKPIRLLLYDVRSEAPAREAPGEIRCLAPRSAGHPRAFIDLRPCDGAVELGVVKARELHGWLGRWLEWRDAKEKP